MLLKRQKKHAEDLLYKFCYIDHCNVMGEKVFTWWTYIHMTQGMIAEFGKFPDYLVEKYDYGEVLNSHSNFAGL